MRAFVSYARKDADAVKVLCDDFRLGDGRTMALGGSPVPAKRIAELVTAVKLACEAQQRRA